MPDPNLLGTIVVNVDRNLGVSYTCDPMPLSAALGALELVKTLLSKPLLQEEAPRIVPAPGAALRALPKDRPNNGSN